MNVNPRSEQFGTTKPWDDLTEEEKASGDWILLPDVSTEPRRARKSEEAAIREERERQARVFDAFFAASGPPATAKGSFDALGRPR